MSLKKIDANIKRIVTSAAKLNVLIHETAMAIAEHAKEHGDCTRALTLVRAMPASMRRTMLVLWFNTYTPIRVVEANDKVGMLKPDAKGFTPFDLEAGNDTPFYELAEQNKEAEPMDFDKLMALIPALAKRIQKKIDEGQVQENAVEAGQRMVIALQSLKIERPKAVNDKYDTLPEEAAA